MISPSIVGGARGGTRTPDAHLRTVALYPLSYTGKCQIVGGCYHNPAPRIAITSLVGQTFQTMNHGQTVAGTGLAI